MDLDERRARRDACVSVIRGNDIHKWLHEQLEDISRLRDRAGDEGLETVVDVRGHAEDSDVSSGRPRIPAFGATPAGTADILDAAPEAGGRLLLAAGPSQL